MSPTYFHTTLTYYEANDFISGYNRRHRHTYEAARLLHGVIGGLFAKNYTPPEFPWDKEERPQAPEYTQDDIDRLRTEATAWADRLNKTRS